MTTGPQAETDADIAVAIADVASEQTYPQVGVKGQSDPASTALTGQMQTLFHGEVLRGLLLSVGFWMFGEIAN